MASSDLNDPLKNFAAPRAIAVGARLNEHTLRQLVSWGLSNIRENVDVPKENIIDELFVTLSESNRAQIKKFIRENTNIHFSTNWPPLDTPLPFIAFVNGSETEDEGFEFLGDHVGFAEHNTLGGGVLSARQELGSGLKCQTTILIASDDPNLTMYLYWLVWFIIFVNKDDLYRYYGIRDLSLSGQDLRWDDSMWPTFAYFKTISCSYSSFFSYNAPEVNRRLIALNVAVATDFTVAGETGVVDDAGAATVSDVPYEEE